MNRVPLRDRCRNRWRNLLPSLGIDSRFLTNKQGPCPMCEGKDRFRWDNKDGDGTFYCNHCGAGDGIRLLELNHGWDFKEIVQQVEPLLGDAHAERAKPTKGPQALFDAMRRVWSYGEPLTLETTAGRYLQGRGCPLPKSGDVLAAPRLRHVPSNSDWPAMMAMVRTHDGTPINLHRTWLAADASGKAPVDRPRMVMEGDLPDGCAVRLFPAAVRMGIAEGIETALSAKALTGVPTWAALNEGRLAVWWPPEGVTEVVIFGDHDVGCAGQAAAYTLAKRLIAKKIAAVVRLPATRGSDWNDVLTRQKEPA